ncbi:MAG: formate dehydrogenase accessory sulfurtransferase FdhD, partial [Gemmataceae bacterium]|nr:formate dehydrogenase accessory sulfurtransferase FdhD [Gemmataceae bacterium]
MHPANPHNTRPQPDPAITRARVRTVATNTPGLGAEREDWVAVEGPLELRLGGKPLTVMMRTPGHDEELAAGFLFGEGIVADADEIIGLERPTGVPEAERGNVLEVRLVVSRRVGAVDRPFFSTS